jgi:hypothetical protein
VEFKCGEVGDIVAVHVPMVNHCRGDARNILGVIINRDISTDIYTIAVKAGVLKGGYSRNQFDLCPLRLLSMSDMNLDKPVSLRSAVAVQSASGVLLNATMLVGKESVKQTDVRATKQN